MEEEEDVDGDYLIERFGCLLCVCTMMMVGNQIIMRSRLPCRSIPSIETFY